jgi:hypothetical protein
MSAFAAFLVSHIAMHRGTRPTRPSNIVRTLPNLYSVTTKCDAQRRATPRNAVPEQPQFLLASCFISRHYSFAAAHSSLVSCFVLHLSTLRSSSTPSFICYCCYHLCQSLQTLLSSCPFLSPPPAPPPPPPCHPPQPPLRLGVLGGRLNRGGCCRQMAQNV